MQLTKEELESCPCGSCSFGWANAQECKEGDCQDICSDYKKWKEGLKESEFEECPICRGEGVVMDSDDECTNCGGRGKVGGKDETNTS